MLYAYIKKEDWLKETATKIISRIIKGEFGQVFVPRECLHELHCISTQEDVSKDELIQRQRLLICSVGLRTRVSVLC